MKTEAQDIQEIAAFRESLYRFFSDCLLRPPANHIAAAWQDPEWREGLLRLLDLPSADFAPSLDLADSQALAAEHARLFLVPATQTCPFESYHRAGEMAPGKPLSGPLLAGAAAAVRQVYRSWRLRPEAETEEVPDHAATELRFMAMLIAMERQQRAAGDHDALHRALRAQAEFLDAHIMAWVPTWTAIVQARAHLPFYRSLLQLLARFLEVDRGTLGVLVEA